MSFVKSMEYLDGKRLGKQRVEACQILEILLDEPFTPKNLLSLIPFERKFGAWTRHPAVIMWKGHEEWLKLYLACAIGEWRSRGYTNTIVVPPYNTSVQAPPFWLGDEQFHKSHRSNLMRKNPVYYRQFWSEEDDSLPYFWPTSKGYDVMSSQQTLRVTQIQGDNTTDVN